MTAIGVPVALPRGYSFRKCYRGASCTPTWFPSSEMLSGRQPHFHVVSVFGNAIGVPVELPRGYRFREENC